MVSYIISDQNIFNLILIEKIFKRPGIFLRFFEAIATYDYIVIKYILFVFLFMNDSIFTTKEIYTGKINPIYYKFGISILIFIIVSIFIDKLIELKVIPKQSISSDILNPPSKKYIFGTDRLGNDVLSQTLKLINKIIKFIIYSLLIVLLLVSSLLLLNIILPKRLSQIFYFLIKSYNLTSIIFIIYYCLDPNKDLLIISISYSLYFLNNINFKRKNLSIQEVF